MDLQGTREYQRVLHAPTQSNTILQSTEKYYREQQQTREYQRLLQTPTQNFQGTQRARDYS